VIRVAGDSEMRMSETHVPEGLRPSSLIRVFVPSADRFGRPLKLQSLLRTVLRHLLTFTAGATIYKGTGFWHASTGLIIREQVWIVEAYVFPGMDANTLRRFLRGLSMIALSSGQEAWLVVLDGTPLLLPPTSVPVSESTGRFGSTATPPLDASGTASQTLPHLQTERR